LAARDHADVSTDDRGILLRRMTAPRSTKSRDRASFDCDVLVAGGGPAGSTAASWLARQGRRVIVIERDQFPRFHVGESLLASVNDVFDAIGVSDTIRAAGFPQKWGATFMTADGVVERYADFSVSGIRAPQTWQVPRARFDDLLLKHAASCGADVREQQRVIDATFDDCGVTAVVQARSECVERYEVRARAIIDASGRGSLLSRKFNLRVDEAAFANIAVFSHYSAVPRQEGRRAGDIRIVSRNDLGWFWLIPISEELMSVGVVLPRDAAPDTPYKDWLDHAIAETPALSRLMAGARREWPVRVEKDFSFGSRAYGGSRWLLAGDAGSFLDPVFSTGVAIALESGLEAARTAAACLDADNWSGAALRAFAKRQRRRYLSFRRFVVGFYTREFRELFFAPDPPRRMFRAMVTVFAGYWDPPLMTRAWILLFFVLVRLRVTFTIAPARSRLAGGNVEHPAVR
jgi:flavin-dependent dehydrogenase